MVRVTVRVKVTIRVRARVKVRVTVRVKVKIKVRVRARVKVTVRVRARVMVMEDKLWLTRAYHYGLASYLREIESAWRACCLTSTQKLSIMNAIIYFRSSEII